VGHVAAAGGAARTHPASRHDARHRDAAPAGRSRPHVWSGERRAHAAWRPRHLPAPVPGRSRARRDVDARAAPMSPHPPRADRSPPWRRRAQPRRSATPRTSIDGWPRGPALRTRTANARGSRATAGNLRSVRPRWADARIARTTAGRAPRARRGTGRRTATDPCRSQHIGVGTRRRAPERPRCDAIGDRRHRADAATAGRAGSGWRGRGCRSSASTASA
jgi:hypothetical protein